MGRAAGGRPRAPPPRCEQLPPRAEGALVALATSEAEAVQAATTAQAQATVVQATADALSTEVANLEATVNAEPTATRTPPPTPTPLPEAGTVLYQADESGGFEEWPASGSWGHLNGMLINNGTEDRAKIVAPYQPGVADYAVEAEIQVVRHPTNCDGLFSVFGKGNKVASGRDDPNAQIVSGFINWECDPAANIWLFDDAVGTSRFDPGSEWHTYRIEFLGNNVRFLIDGTEVISESDNRIVSALGNEVGVEAFETQINVRSFKVIAL